MARASLFRTQPESVRRGKEVLGKRGRKRGKGEEVEGGIGRAEGNNGKSVTGQG